MGVVFSTKVKSAKWDCPSADLARPTRHRRHLSDVDIGVCKTPAMFTYRRRFKLWNTPKQTKHVYGISKTLIKYFITYYSIRKGTIKVKRYPGTGLNKLSWKRLVMVYTAHPPKQTRKMWGEICAVYAVYKNRLQLQVCL